MERRSEMHFSAIVRASLSIMFFLLFSSNLCLAESPTPEELCRKRNAASCEASGLKFFIEDDCPRGTRTLRPKGTERCEQSGQNTMAEKKPQADTAVIQGAQPAVAEASRPQPEAGTGFFGSAYFFLLLIGLIQGVISRAAAGPLAAVLIVMPLLGTWALLSAMAAPAGTAEYWAQAGMVLLQTVLFSMAGWAAGMAIRMGVLKLPFR